MLGNSLLIIIEPNLEGNHTNLIWSINVFITVPPSHAKTNKQSPAPQFSVRQTLIRISESASILTP